AANRVAAEGAAKSVPARRASKDLVVVSWGDVYTRSQMLAFINPYRQQASDWVDVETYSGGLDEIRAQARSANVTWDVVDFEQSDLLRACKEGLLTKIDHAILAPGADGTPAADDFIPGALTECGIGQSVWATVVAYDSEAVGAEAPTTLAEFFDVRAFPGKRGMRRDPRVAMEWALLADGVAPADVYATLSTEEGRARAFRMLDRIRTSIVWWRDGAEPVSLLQNDEVVMTSVWNGRTYGPIVDDGAPIGLVWDGQIWDIDSWGIPAGTYNLAKAQDFITFATSTEALAAQTNYISYGPARTSSMALVADDVKVHLPTTEEHLASALQINAAWWADNVETVTAEFEQWLVRGGRGLSGSAR
ncbi:MAG: ABC transporter substrate-binding protein, partial [Pseudomonadota bacterium]